MGLTHFYPFCNGFFCLILKYKPNFRRNFGLHCATYKPRRAKDFAARFFTPILAYFWFSQFTKQKFRRNFCFVRPHLAPLRTRGAHKKIRGRFSLYLWPIFGSRDLSGRNSIEISASFAHTLRWPVINEFDPFLPIL